MDVRDFDFDLPQDLIAQEPVADRGAARLLVLDRATDRVTHTSVVSLPDLLRDGDVLVVNNTRVFPARLLGHRVPSGGDVECLLVRRLTEEPSAGTDRLAPSDPGRSDEQCWEALMHPGQKLRPGGEVVFEGPGATIRGEILARRFHGRRVIRLSTTDGSSIERAVDAIGHVPLPPYIKREDRAADRDRYQTVFARERGSVAAPTAGLHFSPRLLASLASRGIGTIEITLHVGYGTFQPVRVEEVEAHRVEPEHYEVSDRAAVGLARAMAEGRRIIAVGTTTTRALETVARDHDGLIVAGAGWTDLFVYPGWTFRVVGGLLTNFHLPRSSLLMLVSAFGGRERVLAAYRTAIAERYRFYSYGDAMLIL